MPALVGVTADLHMTIKYDRHTHKLAYLPPYYQLTDPSSKQILSLWPQGYKTFSILNSAEPEIFPAHKC